MNEPLAKRLLVRFGLPDDSWKQFTSHQDTTGEFLINARAAFAYVNTVEALRKLATFINPGHAEGFPRAQLLWDVNEASGTSNCDLPKICKLVTTVALAADLRTIVQSWIPDHKTMLFSFIKARVAELHGQNAEDIVASVLPMATMIGQNRLHILDVMKRVTDAGGGKPKNLSPDNLAAVIRMHTAFNGGKFTGFTRWGPGNAADKDPQTNLRNHFEKHVCNSTGLYNVEAVWWWRALEIKVTKADLQPAASPAEAVYFLGNGSLSPNSIAGFITNVVLKRPPLLASLFAAYGNAYRDYALQLSRELSGVIVEAAAGEVMISGFSGSLASFGRYDDQNVPGSPLGISSCYFVETKSRANKITVDKDTKLWEIKAPQAAP